MTNSITLVRDVLRALECVAKPPCALHEPTFGGNAEAYVADCIQTGWVSSVGAYVDRLEQDLAIYTGAKHCIATVNGTAALHVALLLAGVKPNEEVLVPALSFVATANAVVNCNAVPHFVDVADETLGMDHQQMKDHLARIGETKNGQLFNQHTGRRIAAIVPMHTFGHPCEIEQLCEVADEFQIPVVEDAAESLGSSHRGKHTGTFGKLGAVSFNGNKVITTGGGGAILTDDSDLAKLAKRITTTAKEPHPWLFNHDMHAFNFRMPNLNAALGCAQLEMLPDFLAQKRQIAGAYQAALSGIDGVKFVVEPEEATSNYWLNAIRFPGCDETFRDSVLTATNEVKLMTRPCWTPLNRLPMYTSCPASDLAVSDQIFRETINIPSGCGILTNEA